MLVLYVNLKTCVTERWVAVTTDSRGFDLRHAGRVELNKQKCKQKFQKMKGKKRYQRAKKIIKITAYPDKLSKSFINIAIQKNSDLTKSN